MQESLERIRQAFANGQFQFSLHAAKAAYEEHILPSEILEAVETAVVLEDYPTHQRGPCCLIYGKTKSGRDIHVVCTTSDPPVIVITVYEPKEPKWDTPTQRRRT